jgi:hypothetical protein
MGLGQNSTCLSVLTPSTMGNRTTNYGNKRRTKKRNRIFETQAHISSQAERRLGFKVCKGDGIFASRKKILKIILTLPIEKLI